MNAFGDPTVSWSILLRADLAEEPDPGSVGAGLTALCARFPHLGPPPEIVMTSTVDSVRHDFAVRPYVDGGPLVRAACGENWLLVAAHHGACDGLGLLALLGAALHTEVSSGAVGVAERAAGESFLRSATRRVTEALLHPPTRVEPARHSADSGEVLVSHDEPRAAVGTARLTAAAAATVAEWNRRHQGTSDGLIAAVGLSRRGGGHIEPRDESAFLRLPVSATSDAASVRRALAEEPPEPAFPDSPGLITTIGTRLLAGRLGSSFLVSNLGRVSTSDTVRSLAFHPAASGRSSVAFGAVTVADTTTVTLRARARDFDAASAGELLSELIAQLRQPT